MNVIAYRLYCILHACALDVKIHAEDSSFWRITTRTDDSPVASDPLTEIELRTLLRYVTQAWVSIHRFDPFIDVLYIGSESDETGQDAIIIRVRC